MRDELVHLEQGLFHGACALERVGREGLLKLPVMERGKLRLADVGPAIMRQLVELAERDPRFDRSRSSQVEGYPLPVRDTGLLAR